MDQRTIKWFGRSTAIVLLLLLAAPASAQDASRLSRGQVFHDAAGRVTGSARTDANGVTTFHDRAGRVTGTARTDSNDVTTLHDASQVRSGDEGQWLSTMSEWFTPPEYFEGPEPRPLTTKTGVRVP